MRKNFYRLITGVLLAGWMIVIFQFSAQPAVKSSKMSGTVAYGVVIKCNELFDLGFAEEDLQRYTINIEHLVRKAAHMAEYAVCGNLMFACMAGYWKRSGKLYLAALAATFLYAATDEFHQLYVAGRAGQFGDVCIDTAGAAIGLLALYFVLRCKESIAKKRSLHYKESEAQALRYKRKR